MILFDATHTSHTAAQTGIQRVCRALHAELVLANRVSPICFDPHLSGWRPLIAAEIATLNDRKGGTGKSRGAKWSLSQKITGTGRRWLGSTPALPKASGLICPEIFSAKVGARLPDLLPSVAGPRVAIFYDAIPLKFPELTPKGTVGRFPHYLRELLMFDGVAAISEDSAASLRDYWRWLGIAQAPPVHAIPLGVDQAVATEKSDPAEMGARPRLLCVSTVEGRKNHLALLDACEALWRDGREFELQLIGLARPDTAAEALERIHALQQAGRLLIYQGSVAENGLQAAYRQCRFTLYPSLSEGFGLPVLESLQHGKPCICSGRGALGEAARGGGCLVLDRVDADSLAAAIRRLLDAPNELAALSTAARNRHFRSWREYADKFTTWMATLPPS